MKNTRLAILSILLLLCAAYLFYNRYVSDNESYGLANGQGIVNRTFRNYGKSTAKAAKKYEIPQEYLLALIALECSGRKTVPHRFEPHVYRKLQQVKSGKLKKFEKANHKLLKSMSNSAIKNLSRSWGPYQVMGYKVFELGVKIEDLRGSSSVLVGTRWIEKTYGKALKERRFKDAFHIHNTGSPYPKNGPPRTYNKKYVPRGLKYMEEFQKLIEVVQ